MSRPSSNPAPTASRRATIAALGTYHTRPNGRASDGCGPISSAECRRSYSAIRPRCAAGDTIRGATIPTAGSSRWASSSPGNPGEGTQSLSRNTTIGVVARRRPVLRAAETPWLVGCRASRALARWASAAIASGLGDPSSTTITGQRPDSAARHSRSSSLRACTGTTIVSSALPSSDSGGSESNSPASSSRRASSLSSRASPTGRPNDQPATSPAAAGREREQSQGRAAEQQPAVAERPQVRGRAQPPTSWDRGPVHPRDKTRVGAIAAPTDADGPIGSKPGKMTV